jgi:hypothetical protein
MGWLLFLIARNWPTPAFFSVMTLWAFDPLFLAYSSLSKTDLPAAFFFLSALWVNQKSNQRPSPLMNLLTGFLSGLCVMSKFTGLALITIIPLLDFLYLPPHERFSKSSLSALLKKWVPKALGGAGIIALVYLPATLNEPSHFGPFHYFWDALSMRITAPDFMYFGGTLSQQNRLIYYPLMLLLKTPLSLLSLMVLGYFLIAFKKITVPLWQWLPGVIFFIELMTLQNNGIRNALPAFPFFLMVAAQTAGFLWNWRPSAAPSAGKIVVGGLLLFQAVSVGWGPSHPISYANELLPHNKKIIWLGSTNLDAGQDTKRMALFARERGWDHVKLAYVGLDDPRSYGLNWNYWTESDLKAPQPGWVYLVNIGFLQLAPAFMPQSGLLLNSWLTKITPTGEIADTWYYFEIPGKVDPKDNSKMIISAPLFDYFRKFYSVN